MTVRVRVRVRVTFVDSAHRRLARRSCEHMLLAHEPPLFEQVRDEAVSVDDGHFAAQHEANGLRGLADVRDVLAWLVSWLGGWLVGWMDGWMVGWLVGWLVGWMGGWLVGWMVGWLVGWLDKWMDGWMDGWIVS